MSVEASNKHNGEPLKGMNRENTRKIKTNTQLFSLCGRWEALVGFKILPWGVGTISTPILRTYVFVIVDSYIPQLAPK